VRFSAASDQTILVYLGEEISRECQQRVVRLLRLLQQGPLPWVRNLQPAYCSLLVQFDSCAVDHAEVEAALRDCELRAEAIPIPEPRMVEIPVCYGGIYGPDLEDVAAAHELMPAQVMEFHSAQTYQAYFLGFAPGFAGRQTGVYPFATPGGWRLIGRTPLPMFRADREPMNLVSLGDAVRFRPITQDEFTQLEPR